MKQIITIVILVIATQLSKAQIVTDRPDQTESSSTIDKENLQVETGFLLGFEGENSSTKQILLPTTLFRYGVSNWGELRLVHQFENFKYNNTKTAGISDLEVGTKIQLLQQKNKTTEIAFLTHLVLPTGSAELTNNNVGTINKLSISHPINEEVGLGYNVGYNYFGEGNGDVTYSLAIGKTINDKIGVYVEPYGELQNTEKFIANFDTGLTYQPKSTLQLDASFGAGLNQTMNYFSIGCSILMTKSNN